MKKSLSVLLLLAFALPAFGQSVTLPAEVKGMRGAWIIVAPSKIDGGVPKWQWDPALQEIDLSALLPPELTKNMRGRVFTSQVDGKFWVRCWNAKGDVASDMATCWLVVGTPGPAPPVPPGPGPGPGPMPMPPNPGDLGPFGGAAGLHVLIVHETSVPIAKDQFAAIYGKEFRAYIEEKCAKVDGTPQRRIYDKDIDLAGESKLWKDALGRKRISVPWIALGNGQAWFEGPLPATKAEIMNLFKKVGV